MIRSLDAYYKYNTLFLRVLNTQDKNMKVALLILTFVFIQPVVSLVTRQKCLDAGIKNSSLPETVPVANPATDGPCSDNTCCTSAYIDKLRDSVRVNVFRECVRETFEKVLDIADDFFDDFNDLFGDSGREALISSFKARAEVGDDTRDAYIYSELSYISKLLANITYSRIRGIKEGFDFKMVLREYACGFLASVVQKDFYNSTLRIGRIGGKCLCDITRVGDKVDAIINELIIRFTEIINNIVRLIKAISGIRQVSIQNLRIALDYNVSSLCSRQYINAIACLHCAGNQTRGCPASCRFVSLFCLQPLSNALTGPYAAFIKFVTLSLSTIVGNNSDTLIPFDLHNVQEVTGELSRDLRQFATKSREALSEFIAGQNLVNSKCFITKTRDIEDGRVKCMNSTGNDDSSCKVIDGMKFIVDVDSDSDREDDSTNTGSSRGSRDTDTTGREEPDSDSDSDDDFERTDAERNFEKFVSDLSERFRKYANFNMIFNRINQCVCRASSSDGGSLSTGDNDRLKTLFISQSNCYQRYRENQSPQGLEDNPAFESLTSVDKNQARMFDTVVKSRFTDLAQLVADDPELSATFSQLQGESSAGSTLTSFLFVICSALLTVLFMLV